MERSSPIARTPMEVEITAIPALSETEANILDMHSLLNVMNVLMGELQYLGLELNDLEIFAPSIQVLDDIVAAFVDRQSALAYVQDIKNVEAQVRDNLTQALQQYPQAASLPDVQESLANIDSIFTIVEIRAVQLLARAQDPQAWKEVSITQLTQNFHDIFSAIEKNSKGRYRILYNVAQQETTDYYINLDISSVRGQTIWMPPVLEDVMRDLMANARKYTPIGGRIIAGLCQTDQELRLVVEDNGCGIPAAEVETVVGFGRRGSNVQGKPTMGGGFGLTKAFLIAKQFQGRMWIRSDLGLGTRIKIVLPLPQALSA